MTESHPPTLLAGQRTEQVGYVGIDAVIAGRKRLKKAFKERRAVGDRVIVVDATSNAPPGWSPPRPTKAPSWSWPAAR